MNKIIIHYVEFTNEHPLGPLTYAEWTRDGIDEYGHAEEESFGHRDGEVQGIPPDVRQELVRLVEGKGA